MKNHSTVKLNTVMKQMTSPKLRFLGDGDEQSSTFFNVIIDLRILPVLSLISKRRQLSPTCSSNISSESRDGFKFRVLTTNFVFTIDFYSRWIARRRIKQEITHINLTDVFSLIGGLFACLSFNGTHWPVTVQIFA